MKIRPCSFAVFKRKSRTILSCPKNMKINYLFQQCMGNPDWYVDCELLEAGIFE